MPKDDLAQARAFRDDLRALKVLYPELTTPAAQRRLEAYLRTQMDDVGIHITTKENTMPRPGDRMLGEDLTIMTFRIPTSALPLIEEHLRRMQRESRWVRIGKSDAQRDIFLRGLDAIEGLETPMPPRPLVEPEPEPAAQVEIPLEEEPEDRPRARRVPVPQDEDIENMPLVPTDGVVDVPTIGGQTAKPKAAAKAKRTTAKGRK